MIFQLLCRVIVTNTGIYLNPDVARGVNSGVVMKLSDHMERTRKIIGEPGKEIHEWIDGCFVLKKHKMFMKMPFLTDYNPYDHRKKRHCREALVEAVQELKHLYPVKIIKSVFELHVRDDYNGYFPSLKDFENPDFLEKYHLVYEKSLQVIF